MSLRPENLQQFQVIWAMYDPTASHCIPSTKLETLLRDIPPPLGLGRDCPMVTIRKTIAELEIPDHGGFLHYMETFIALANRISGVDLDSLPDIEVTRLVEQQRAKALTTVSKLADAKNTTAETYAATFVQSAFRSWKARQEVNRRRFVRMMSDSNNIGNGSSASLLPPGSANSLKRMD
eukprot:TRINITY_DN13372_c0_g1::TRINITY_DN13372_c0_g1_i1::g.9595::m.9595 TRINITY_DN13372_c0_g1::TRINITY_DN13372_c0_g1_i1::g.9595  ORF type:complete len:179 (+),score=40.03,sp/O57483/CAC1S_LITCT/28.67/5e-11,IQ/PF00612.22/0.0024 TRINITY_DN13372_c0_g1_i1:2-538(+)